jgi:HAD superfamily hydrolase (TIGR01450 family)
VAAERWPIDLSEAATSGFMFDVDGTLAHRGPNGRAVAQPGALEVLERIRASGRRLVLFTNGSHVPSSAFAQTLRDDGIPIADDEMLTPTDSATSYLLRYHREEPVQLFASPSVTEWMQAQGVRVTTGDDARVVYVAHLQQVDLDEVERAGHAVHAGAPLLCSSFVRGYAGSHRMILSRGAMITAAIAKAGGRRPRVIGKPSRVAATELARRLGVPGDRICVIGDDASMDIVLGRLGGSSTVLVRSGTTGAVAVADLPERHRPDVAIDAVAELLDHL